MVQVSRPSGVNIGVNNPGTTAYITGSEFVDGSLRYQIIDIIMTKGVGIEPVTEIQKRVDGIWQPTSFKAAGASVRVGTLVSLEASGRPRLALEAVCFFERKRGSGVSEVR